MNDTPCSCPSTSPGSRHCCRTATRSCWSTGWSSSTPNKRIARAIKNVSINEPFFQGHFPGHPVMPGVLVIEALAQAGGLLTQLSPGRATRQSKLFYLVKIDNARFSAWWCRATG